MIGSLLVANRGEIARRIFRSAREMGIRCLAIYVDDDEDSPYVREADAAVRLTTGYLDVDAIVDAARRLGADAVHPGYGFLSENTAFAAAVAGADLIWVGPSAATIAAMGDKLTAKQCAMDAGVPTLPSSDRVDDPAEAQRIGFPLLVKAAAGGGGKGMRVVDRPFDLADAIAAARREARGAFGDDRVFLERYISRARHVEVQLLGDRHGNLVHLGERECSIQRRHQKVLEESPSPVIDEQLRVALGEAALRLGRAIGYESAGTVEMLLDEASREFFFLEVNTRLQVEHPVTEEVTGIDIVREQLRVAAGETLAVRQADIAATGHAIEARLYAEDPSNDFLPATGTLHAFEPALAPAVRWDSGVEPGSVVGTKYDPMLAKATAYGATRTEAAARLALALERLHLGGVVTNRDFLVSILRSDAFIAGNTTTDFIERARLASNLVLGEGELERAAIAAAMWIQARNRAQATVWAGIPSGWRNARLPAQRITFETAGRSISINYRAQRDGSFLIDGNRIVHVPNCSPAAVDVVIDDRRQTFRVTTAGDHVYVQVSRGTLSLRQVPRFGLPTEPLAEGGLVAPMPGTVINVSVEPGDTVATGQVVAVIEAMKMEHHVKAPSSGRIVEVRAFQGQQVEHGAVLMVLETVADAGTQPIESIDTAAP